MVVIEVESLMSRMIEITELALRDAHQSLLATRMALDDMTPVCEEIDNAGYWSVECWGGATFDSCIRFLNEDPWERLRTFRKLMPKSRLQMLLRGQNLLGYRHYEDEVVERFVEKAAALIGGACATASNTALIALCNRFLVECLCDTYPKRVRSACAIVLVKQLMRNRGSTRRRSKKAEAQQRLWTRRSSNDDASGDGLGIDGDAGDRRAR